MNKTILWRICKALAVLCVIATFTPLAIPAGKIDPMVLGMPYTLGVGIIISVLLVILTILATILHPERKNFD